MILSAANLQVHYGLFQALFDVSFEVGEQEAVCFLGGNGAGKTTALRAVLGALPLSGGTVEFLGQPTNGIGAESMVAKGLIYVPDGRELFPSLTVLENLELGATTPHARARMRQTLDFVYELFPVLAERQRQLAGTLSGGQQQMVAIGRGLMGIPKLLMLDEPSLGLAPVIIESVYAVLRRILSAGTPIVLVEQHVHHALALCSRGYVFESGRVVQSGPTEELAASDRLRSAYLGVD
jgi:branched-chain amino acid transport system ATP-binding protein